jgi:VanZ family protein
MFFRRRIESNTIHKLRKLAGVMALVWMCVIFGFSAQTKEESSVVSEGVSYRLVESTGFFFHLHLDEEQLREIANSIENAVRKGAHMTEYAILAILIYIWIGQWELTLFRKSCIAVLASALYACSDEAHQLFVAGRAGRFTDVMIDSAGALLGLALFLVVCRVIGHLRIRRNKA